MAGGQGASSVPAGPHPVSGAAIAFAAPSGASPWKRWLLYSAIARITLFCVLAGGGMAAAFWLLTHGAPQLRQLSSETRALWRFAIQVACFVSAYLFLVRVIERRRPVELFPSRGLAQFAAGTLAGLALMTVT